MTSIVSKLPQVGTTIFSVVSQLAVENNAINLGQGFPNYPMNTQLQHLVTEAMSEGFNQYAPTNGYRPLVEALAAKFLTLYNAQVDPYENITITPGGTYAIFTALATLLHTGDEAIILDPSYDCYAPTVLLNGSKPVFVPMQLPNFDIDWAQVENAITPKTKVLILNNPHNPTGRIFEKSDIEALQQIIGKHNIFLISDEVYEHLVYDGKQHLSLLHYPDLAEKTFVCFSFGKTYNCTGWKLGYAVAPNYLMKEFRKIHQFNCFSCFTPAQVAISKFLSIKEEYLSLGKMMQRKRDLLQQLLQDTPLKALPSHGSYFQCYDYQGKMKQTGLELAKKLITDYQVATIPISAFYNQKSDENQILRFCFCKTDDMLRSVANNLQKLQ